MKTDETPIEPMRLLTFLFVTAPVFIVTAPALAAADELTV
jgi:hypothetical protein